MSLHWNAAPRGALWSMAVSSIDISQHDTPCGGEVSRVCPKMSRTKLPTEHHVAPHRRCHSFVHVSCETPDVIPCHTSPPQGAWYDMSYAISYYIMILCHAISYNAVSCHIIINTCYYIVWTIEMMFYMIAGHITHHIMLYYITLHYMMLCYNTLY